MLKTLIKIRLQGILLRQLKSSKKEKGNGIGKIILMVLLFGYVAVVFGTMFCMFFHELIEPLHMMGIDWLYFAVMALMAIMLCFIGSVFLAHHEIYEAKDNDLLLSMPIKNRDILLSRVFSILILNYIYELLVAGPAFGVYIVMVGMNAIQVIMFMVVILTLPLFVLSLSCLFGWILAHVLKHSRMKNIVTLVLFLVGFGAYFYAINSIQQYINWLISNGESIANAIERGLFPLYHLSIAISDGNFISILIYLLCALLPFALVMYLLSANFVKLATSRPKAKKKEYVAKPMKSHSLYSSLLVREVKHFTSNAMVMLNGAIGIVFTLVAIVAVLIYAQDLKSLLVLFSEYSEFLTAGICIVVIGVSSMNIISASSISLEGNRLWILKSLPVHTLDILHTKFLLHFLLCVPAGIVLSLICAVIFEIGIFNTMIAVITPILFTSFIDLLGLLLNLWKPKFDWVNETVCVKQSMPSILTMFISIGVAFVLAALYVIFCYEFISITVYMCMMIVFFTVLDLALYYLLRTWGVQKFETL